MKVLIGFGGLVKNLEEGGNQLRDSWEEGDGCTVVWSKVLTGVGLNMGYGL